MALTIKTYSTLTDLTLAPTVSSLDTPCAAYRDMAVAWKLPCALMGGTRAMQEAKTAYLPQYPAETAAEYNSRLAASTLFNGYRRTVRLLCGQPFGKPVVLKNAGPEEEEIAADVDLQGTDLTGFARSLLEDMLVYGKCHALCDYPEASQLATQLGRPLTLGEEQKYRLRPYFAEVSPANLIAWRAKRVLGQEVLEQIRIRHREMVPDGQWGEKREDQIQVWYPDRTDIYVLQSGDTENKWLLRDSVVRQGGPPGIPLVTGYGIRTGLLSSSPPLEDLAWVNLQHWQSASDQTNILHFARTYLLAFMGWEPEELQVVNVGTGRGIANRDPAAHVDVVEHSGAAIGAGRTDLEDKEDQMQALGSELLAPRPGNETATARAITHAENVSDLQAMVSNLERTLEELFALAAAWQGRELPEGFAVDISEDWGALGGQDKSLPELRADYQLGVIDRRTYLAERRRYGLYSDSLDIEETLAAAEVDNPFFGGPVEPAPTEEQQQQTE